LGFGARQTQNGLEELLGRGRRLLLPLRLVLLAVGVLPRDSLLGLRFACIVRFRHGPHRLPDGDDGSDRQRSRHDPCGSGSNPPPFAIFGDLHFRRPLIEFRRPRPVFGCGPQPRDAGGHLSGVRRAIRLLDGQATLAECDEFRFRSARIEPSECVLQFAAFRELPRRFPTRCHVGRMSGQNHAEDRAEAEDIAAGVDLIPGAARLFGRHVRRSSEHRSGPRLVVELSLRFDCRTG